MCGISFAFIQGELTKRDLQLKGALNGSADKSFAAAAGLASSGEKAVVQLACLDPTVDSDALLPASKPVPGTLLCVRCEKSLNQVRNTCKTICLYFDAGYTTDTRKGDEKLPPQMLVYSTKYCAIPSFLFSYV